MFPEPAWSFLKRPVVWHVTTIVAVASYFESLFLRRGLGLLDEGWPLYAAQRLLNGGTLYADVTWCFPPGHVLPALIGRSLGEPGIVETRMVYAAFCVALSVSIYFLARRLGMSTPFAFLAVSLVTLAADVSHNMHYLFAFRYLVLAIAALLLFDRWLQNRGHRWLLLSGLMTGITLFFRLTPAFAVACGIAVGIASSSRDWRGWLRSSTWYAGGVLVILVPTLLWFKSTVGLGTFYHEVVVRPLAMLQSLPWPPLEVPATLDRFDLQAFFIALQFRLGWLLYFGYVVVLAMDWVRSRRRRESYAAGLLLAVTVFGAVYFLRTLGRSDQSHLDSALPPVFLLLAHALWLAGRRFFRSSSREQRLRTVAEAAVAVGVVAIWLGLLGAERYHGSAAHEAAKRDPGLRSAGNTLAISRLHVAEFDDNALAVREWVEPGETFLDLTAAPMFYVLANRNGPGYFDVIMPGTFVSAEEEESFLARLQDKPPAAILWPRHPFDGMTERSIAATAPRVTAWVEERYEPVWPERPLERILLKPRDATALRIQSSR